MSMRESCAGHPARPGLAPRLLGPAAGRSGHRAPLRSPASMVPMSRWRSPVMRRQLLVTLLIGALAASVSGCSSDATSPTSPVDLSPPAAPGNLQASTDPATGSEWLDWDPSASVNVDHYEVYVSDTAGGSGSLVAAVDGSASDFLLP